MSATAGAPARADGLSYRPVRPDEIEACAGIWRTSINDYVVLLGQHELPAELRPTIRLFTHLRATDPERFVAAIDAGEDGERLVGFASAVTRERLWFLSMLFVLPEFQGAGVGRRLLARVLPDDQAMARSTATDSAQPISNALYSSYGIVPRMPLLNLSGLPLRPEAFGELPSGVVPIPFESIAAGPPDGPGHRRLAEAVEGLDCKVLGVTHSVDHAFLRSEGRRGWLYHGPDGSPIGYGYAGEAGRLGPVAAHDEGLVAPILRHLTSVVVPRGAFAAWVGGAADRAIVALLGAGFRMESFPILVCWDRPFADFARYLPISPGLL